MVQAEHPDMATHNKESIFILPKPGSKPPTKRKTKSKTKDKTKSKSKDKPKDKTQVDNVARVIQPEHYRTIDCSTPGALVHLDGQVPQEGHAIETNCIRVPFY